jgi:hypothetical protein
MQPISSRRNLNLNNSYMNAILIILFLLVPSPAYGYIDPATGSILLQVIIGGVFAALVVIKSLPGRVRSWFSRNNDKSADDHDANN